MRVFFLPHNIILDEYFHTNMFFFEIYKGCEEGWTYYDESCYLFPKEKKSYEEANSQCESTVASSHIAVINSATENTFIIRQFISKKNFWIGCNDVDENDIWTCEDDSGMFYTKDAEDGGGDRKGYWSKYTTIFLFKLPL